MKKTDIFINENASIIEALKKLDKTAEKVLIVAGKDQKLMGAVTDGDIRGYILKGKKLTNGIKDVYNSNPFYIKKEDYTPEAVKDILLKNKIELLPVVDGDKRVIDFVTWSQAFSSEESRIHKGEKIDVPVLIMAGGKGTRLEPFANIFPKALIPIGDKTVIELIIDKFKEQGVNKFYLMLNYKGELIEAYFNSLEKDYSVKYVKENKFMGTIGGLSLLKKNIEDIFIVSNCDVMVKANFSEVIKFHKEQKASMTILSSIKHYRIPYGVVNFKTGGKVVNIMEKPEYTFSINAGVYIFNKELLRLIPKNSYFDMTDLIKLLLKKKERVVTYPVNENDYIDIGEWEEYRKAIEKMRM